jgi:peptide/nickel transport system permease protein
MELDSGLARYIIRRALQIPPLLFGITILAFLIFYLSPVNPVVAYLGMTTVQKMPAEDIAKVEEQLGLDKPAYERYLLWLEHIAQGDWGFSYILKRPVLDVILERFPATLLLTFTGYGLSMVLGVVMGLASAKREGSPLDRFLHHLNYILYSTPTFLAALLAMLVFAVWLGWLPSSRMISVNEPVTFWAYNLDRIRHIILPASVLAVSHLAVFYTYIRSSLLEAMREDYIVTARAKGLDERTILYRHALRNSLLPFVTQIGLAIPLLIGGSVIVESMFAWPGIGKLTYDAALRADYMLLMGMTLFTSLLVIIGNLMADVAYAILDPRVKYN